MNKQELIDFENEIEEIYTTGVIRGPIHLRDGNEDELISIFQKYYSNGDFVFSTWANHLHAILAGIPKDKIKDRILEGESMAMNFPEYNFYTSAIVGGIIPIAVGVAKGLKFGKVLCFIGDMAFRSGIAHESIMYSVLNDLPIIFIVEDNDKSVGTPTEEAWGKVGGVVGNLVNFYNSYCESTKVYSYKYTSRFAHSGVGTFVSF